MAKFFDVFPRHQGTNILYYNGVLCKPIHEYMWLFMFLCKFKSKMEPQNGNDFKNISVQPTAVDD